MTLKSAIEWARGAFLQKDYYGMGNKRERDMAMLTDGFEAGVEHFRETMKFHLDELFGNDLVKHLGKSEILSYLDIDFEHI